MSMQRYVLATTIIVVLGTCMLATSTTTVTATKASLEPWMESSYDGVLTEMLARARCQHQQKTTCCEKQEKQEPAPPAKKTCCKKCGDEQAAPGPGGEEKNAEADKEKQEAADKEKADADKAENVRKIREIIKVNGDANVAAEKIAAQFGPKEGGDDAAAAAAASPPTAGNKPEGAAGAAGAGAAKPNAALIKVLAEAITSSSGNIDEAVTKILMHIKTNTGTPPWANAKPKAPCGGPKCKSHSRKCTPNFNSEACKKKAAAKAARQKQGVPIEKLTLTPSPTPDFERIGPKMTDQVHDANKDWTTPWKE
jgi:hypothetical protein